jgi:hypothetical protein
VEGIWCVLLLACWHAWGRGGSDVLVAILGWVRCGVPLTDRSGAQHSFNRIIGIDIHVVLWH